MTGIILSPSTVTQGTLLADSAPQPQSSKRKIVEIVAFVALALFAAAIAAIAGLVLSGIVASIIAASATALLMGVGAVVYKIIEPKKESKNTIPIPSPLVPQLVPQLSPIVSIEPPVEPSVEPTISPIKIAPAPIPEWTIAKLKDRVAKNKQIIEERIQIEQELRASLKTNNPPATTVISKCTIPLLEPLPKLCDLDKYTPPFSLDFPIKGFVDNDMAKKMGELTLAMRQHALSFDNRKLVQSPLQYISSSLANLLPSAALMYSWKRYAAFTEFKQNWKVIFEKKIDPPPGYNHYTLCQNLETEGKNFCLKLVQRLEWLDEIFTREGLAFDPQFCIEAIGTDMEFINAINIYHDSCFKEITTLVHSLYFHTYNEQEKKNLQKKDDWPHNPQLLKDIEKEGFEFTPMPIKRDLCKCKTCGVEVSAWRPWMNPQSLHIASKH